MSQFWCIFGRPKATHCGTVQGQWQACTTCRQGRWGARQRLHAADSSSKVESFGAWPGNSACPRLPVGLHWVKAYSAGRTPMLHWVNYVTGGTLSSRGEDMNMASPSLIVGWGLVSASVQLQILSCMHRHLKSDSRYAFKAQRIQERYRTQWLILDSGWYSDIFAFKVRAHRSKSMDDIFDNRIIHLNY